MIKTINCVSFHIMMHAEPQFENVGSAKCQESASLHMLGHKNAAGPVINNVL